VSASKFIVDDGTLSGILCEMKRWWKDEEQSADQECNLKSSVEYIQSATSRLQT